jgi:hypothetical protein
MVEGSEDLHAGWQTLVALKRARRDGLEGMGKMAGELSWVLGMDDAMGPDCARRLT